MNIDKWGEVINGEETYKKIAEELTEGGKVIIGWTDQKYDHRDILFTYEPTHLGGTLQGGLKWCYLYVSIIGFSCNGFLIKRKTNNRKYNDYLMEKLRLNDNPCNNKVCDLINGVIHAIDELEENIDENI